MDTRVYYIPAKQKADILVAPVQHILAVGHDRTTGPETQPTNHWSFYLVIGGGKSIGLDAQPSYSVSSTNLLGGSKANIVVSELGYALPPDALVDLQLSVRPGLTVGDIMQLLTEAGSFRYEFNSDGVGCRMWITDQISRLLAAGMLVSAVEAETAKSAIKLLYPDKKALALDGGAYY
jgi:hypothetical protein